LDEWNIARLFALIHTAMADSAIYLFRDMYYFYRWRPITAIHKALGGHPLTNNKWNPYLPISRIPRVPEYPASFAVFGGAVGEIMKLELSDNINVVVYSSKSPASPITYTSIDKAVEDNAMTKINCGWNFRECSEDSMKMGRAVGQHIRTHEFKK
jgi:hypothetical protein